MDNDAGAGSKTVQEMWYDSPTVRDLIFRQYNDQWGGGVFTKENFLLGHGNVKTSRHGLTYRDFMVTDRQMNAWELMKGCNVYQSILSYSNRFPIIQDALVRTVDPKADWFRSLAGQQVFSALKFRADLIKSFTFAFDIDAHGKDTTLDDTRRQAYEIGSYFKDRFQFEPVMNISGGGSHVRFPDYMVAQVIDVPRLMADNVSYRHKDYGWVDLRSINDVLVGMTEKVVAEVFGDRHNGVDLNLHNNSGRVFRTLYTIHPKTDTVILPLRLADFDSFDHEACRTGNIVCPDDKHIRRFRSIMRGYKNPTYTYDWSGANDDMPKEIRWKVKNLKDIFFQHTPITFHKYLRNDGNASS